jgi:hypothetical protein
MLLPVLQSGLGNPGIALGPVGAIAGEQAHTVVLPDDQHPIAVVLYFLDPVRPRRDLLAVRRQAELVRHTHARRDRRFVVFCESGTTGNPGAFHSSSGQCLGAA